MKYRLRKNRSTTLCAKPPFPHNILIEVTNKCNLNCIFCIHRQMKREQIIINDQLVEKILNEAYERGTREVGYYLTGEPFLAPNLENLVNIAHNIGYEYIYISTNGILANIERVKELVKNGLNSIKFSINAGTRESYKLIHGRDMFDSVLGNLKDICKWRNEDDVKFAIHVSFVRNEFNIGEEKLLIDEFAELIDEFDIVNSFNQAGKIEEEYEFVLLDNKSKNDKPCEMIFNRLHVTSSGKLVICCFDFNEETIIADLNNTNIGDAWYSQDFQNIRRQHINNTLTYDFCIACRKKRKINGEKT